MRTGMYGARTESGRALGKDGQQRQSSEGRPAGCGDGGLPEVMDGGHCWCPTELRQR